MSHLPAVHILSMWQTATLKAVFWLLTVCAHAGRIMFSLGAQLSLGTIPPLGMALL